MRLRNVKNAKEIVATHPLVVTAIDENTFSNNNPIRLEIGAGKGEFIIQMSETYPNINFVAVERYESVLVRALNRIQNIHNLRFLCLDAKELPNVLKVKIEGLYLNFSDPWPKARHAKRRLTSKVFLTLYEPLFEEVINIYQKTDNKALFAYSVCSLSQNGYIIKDLSLDLASADIPNIETEYEKKFKAKGQTINYLYASKKI